MKLFKIQKTLTFWKYGIVTYTTIDFLKLISHKHSQLSIPLQYSKNYLASWRRSVGSQGLECDVTLGLELVTASGRAFDRHKTLTIFQNIRQMRQNMVWNVAVVQKNSLKTKQDYKLLEFLFLKQKLYGGIQCLQQMLNNQG